MPRLQAIPRPRQLPSQRAVLALYVENRMLRHICRHHARCKAFIDVASKHFVKPATGAQSYRSGQALRRQPTIKVVTALLKPLQIDFREFLSLSASSSSTSSPAAPPFYGAASQLPAPSAPTRARAQGQHASRARKLKGFGDRTRDLDIC